MSSKQAGSLLNALSLAIALLRKQFFRVIFVVYGIKKDENNLPQEQESKEIRIVTAKTAPNGESSQDQSKTE